MKTLEIQKMLRGGKALVEFVEENELALDDCGDLVVLNYGIHTSNCSPCSKECRGTILEKDTWNLVALPFLRFRNLGEAHADSIDWNTAVAIEKIDGSLISLFFYKGEWKLATRGKINGSGGLPIEGSGFASFGDLVRSLITNVKLDTSLTYYLELVSPWNRVVTRYDKPGLFLLTVRNRDFDELSHTKVDEIAKEQGFGRPKRYLVKELKSVEEIIQKLKPDEEGFVVVDAEWKRVKIKKLSYVVLHNTANNGKPDYDGLIATGEDAEFCAYFPEYRQVIQEHKTKVLDRLTMLDGLWQKYRGLVTKKEFALKVKDEKGSWLLFLMYGNKKWNSVMDLFDQMRIEDKRKVLDCLLWDDGDSGSMVVSKTTGQGSIPCRPANTAMEDTE